MAENDRRKKQYITLGILGLGLVGGIFLLGQLMNSGSNTALPPSLQPTIDETIIADRTSGASPEHTFVRQGIAKIEKLEEELDEEIKLAKQARERADREFQQIRAEYDEALLQLVQRNEAQAQEINQLKGQIGPLTTQTPEAGLSGREQLERMQAQNGPGTDFIEQRQPSRRTPNNRNQRSVGTVDQTGAPIGFGQTFTLASSSVEDPDVGQFKTLGNYLPAGSYVPAVVLSGADAATNVANRENPIPVIFRVTGKAVTASLGPGTPARVDLRGCTVQGSATGDLSSERVKVRLIQMTCVNKAGQVLETKVSGYMSGSGKEGVRGHVTSRAGPAVRSALLAGAIGGLGTGLSQGATAGINNENASTTQILEGAALGTIAGGIEGAANTLTEYHINRAEQYQPVVSLYGGTNVELVFLEGVELGS